MSPLFCRIKVMGWQQPEGGPGQDPSHFMVLSPSGKNHNYTFSLKVSHSLLDSQKLQHKYFVQHNPTLFCCADPTWPITNISYEAEYNIVQGMLFVFDRYSLIKVTHFSFSSVFFYQKRLAQTGKLLHN